MKTTTIRHLLASVAFAASASFAPAQAQDVGVSIGINQPGFYGRQRPIYMRVPPGHAKDWRRYCSRYSACNQPVYFVRDDDRRYPSQGRPDHRHDEHRHDDRYHDRDDRHDHRDHDRGHGKGHGKGRGHGHD